MRGRTRTATVRCGPRCSAHPSLSCSRDLATFAGSRRLRAYELRRRRVSTNILPPIFKKFGQSIETRELFCGYCSILIY